MSQDDYDEREGTEQETSNRTLKKRMMAEDGYEILNRTLMIDDNDMAR